ncbi:MAG: carbamoyltransferase HypF [Elusimicrobia bacterium]|nr:carbamoyltransferase HypF [Elusimicrobiota bacterium]
MMDRIPPVADRKFLIKGIVQGVGFRPFIYRAASEMGLSGWVRNTAGGVELRLRGEIGTIESLKKKIMEEAPATARVEYIEEMASDGDRPRGFEIIESGNLSGPNLNISPDIGICAGCLSDIFDPSGRRREYGFTGCLECGPRFTVLRKLPYDRNNTSMGEFPVCSGCGGEYADPSDRRHHAQSICCGDCGPRYSLGEFMGEEAVVKAARLLVRGEVLAVKGWGGYHLVGNALDMRVLAKIRKEKKREHKPFAVMAEDADAVRKFCVMDEDDLKVIGSFSRPVLLLPKKIYSGITEMIAPDNMSIGFMVPYSALHHLLFRHSGLQMMVFTSLNSPSSPTVKTAGEARMNFNGYSLDHDLEIEFRCDDSVIKKSSSGHTVLRRSRGCVPGGIKLPFTGDVLVSGSSENICFCYAKNGYAYPSQYLGSMDEAETQRVYRENIMRFRDVWGYSPVRLGCDMHPSYATTRIFEGLSEEWGLPLVRIQHHHAHLAGCAAENGLSGKLLGAAFDGAGYGGDSGNWGGEFMEFDYTGFKRHGSLKPHPLPGLDMAAREPWRMGISYLKSAGIRWDGLESLRGNSDGYVIEKMIDSGINSPVTSSAGRLFDAVAAIIGAARENTYSSRAPIALESLVDEKYLTGGYGFEVTDGDDGFTVDTSPVIRGIVDDIESGKPRSEIASRFHYTVADIIVKGLLKMSRATGIKDACISGGVFCNYYLEGLVKELAGCAGIRVFGHRQVSPNDNGISYGQAAVCAATERCQI